MIATTKLSEYRKNLSQLIRKIENLAFYCAYSDPLIQGTPGEVFRTCGKKTCKCAIDPEQRHGPYKVLQIYQDKKQKQISLRKNQQEIWQQAKNYQKQNKYLLELRQVCAELAQLVQIILDARTKKWPQ